MSVFDQYFHAHAQNMQAENVHAKNVNTENMYAETKYNLLVYQVGVLNSANVKVLVNISRVCHSKPQGISNKCSFYLIGSFQVNSITFGSKKFLYLLKL